MFQIKQSYGIGDLLEIMELLRSECPWDREQTHESIRGNVIEEAYEVAEAIDNGGGEHLREELGDLLLQVVFHSQIDKESGGGFDFDAVCDGICRKLIYRHPHVFGEVKADTTGEVLKNWDDLKSASKGEETLSERLESVPKLLPALTRAEKVGKKAANAGFDIKDADEALSGVKDALHTLELAIVHKKYGEIEDGFGDVLFACCNLGRFLKKDSEKALTISINRFIMRFKGL